MSQIYNLLWIDWSPFLQTNRPLRLLRRLEYTPLSLSLSLYIYIYIYRCLCYTVFLKCLDDAYISIYLDALHDVLYISMLMLLGVIIALLLYADDAALPADSLKIS